MALSVSVESASHNQRDWATMLFLACGYALCRACAELPMGLQGFETSWEEVGKITGLFIILGHTLLSLRSAPPSFVRFLPDLFLVLGCALGVTCPIIQSPAVGSAAGFFIGAGASALMIAWLEVFGTLPNRRIVVCLALAYVLDVPVGILSTALKGAPIVPTFMCLATAGVLWMNLILSRSQQFTHAAATRPRRASGLDRLLPAPVIAWVLASGISFGIMEAGILGSVAGSGLDIAGRALPCALVVIVYVAVPERFDLKWLYGITLPLLLAGLSLAGNVGAGDADANGLATLLFCMGAAASRLVAYYAVCSRAASCGVSAYFGCACVMLLNVLARNAGVLLSSAPAFGMFSEFFYALAVVTTSSAVVIFLIVELGDSPSCAPDAVLATQDETVGNNEGTYFKEIASSKGLSPREIDVFILLMAGNTTAQISDTLFISTGAVRSHTSRIYDKFGVHTRQELEIAIHSEIDQGNTE